jgi:hypothetical protein
MFWHDTFDVKHNKWSISRAAMNLFSNRFNHQLELDRKMKAISNISVSKYTRNIRRLTRRMIQNQISQRAIMSDFVFRLPYSNLG